MTEYNEKFNKKQREFLKENDLIVIRKGELDKFKFFNYKEPIEELIEKICDSFFSKFKEKVKIYCCDEISEVKKRTKEDIGYMIENFMETVYNYRPSYKKVWSGKKLTEKTMKAIKRHKVFEVFCKKNGKLVFVDTDLVLNRKRAEKKLNNFNTTEKKSEYILVERKIN